MKEFDVADLKVGIIMRLTSAEASVIKGLISKADPDGKVYLFGSRVDDNRKGGDIDIFLEASKKIDFKEQLLLQHRLIAGCDTKVDLVIQNPNDHEEIIHTIAKMGVRL